MLGRTSHVFVRVRVLGHVHVEKTGSARVCKITVASVRVCKRTVASVRLCTICQLNRAGLTESGLAGFVVYITEERRVPESCASGLGAPRGWVAETHADTFRVRTELCPPEPVISQSPLTSASRIGALPPRGRVVVGGVGRAARSDADDSGVRCLWSVGGCASRKRFSELVEECSSTRPTDPSPMFKRRSTLFPGVCPVLGSWRCRPSYAACMGCAC